MFTVLIFLLSFVFVFLGIAFQILGTTAIGPNSEMLVSLWALLRHIRPFLFRSHYSCKRSWTPTHPLQADIDICR